MVFSLRLLPYAPVWVVGMCPLKYPRTLVSLFSGIGSRAVRRASETDKAQIATWIVDDSNYSVSNLTIEASDVRRKKKGGWRIFWDAELERKLEEYRNAKLPKETGGVLIGSYDMARRIIYVFDATEAPPDSQECPHGFLRGSAGLQEAMSRESGKRPAAGSTISANGTRIQLKTPSQAPETGTLSSG